MIQLADLSQVKILPHFFQTGAGGGQVQPQPCQAAGALPNPRFQVCVLRQPPGRIISRLPIVADEQEVRPGGQGLPGGLLHRQPAGDGPHLQVVRDNHPVKLKAPAQPVL